jgi:hypothetical protein
VAAFGILGALMWLPRWYRPEGGLSSDRVLEELTALVLGGVLKPRP